jgi:formylglycine-generating enzyme required for sulfatase activity
MSAWTTRRISQQVVSEDADRMVIEATAPSGTKGFFKGVGGGDTTPLGLVNVQGGSLPQTSGLAGTAVATFQIGKTEVTWDEWQEVRAWAMTNGYSDLAGVGAGSAGGHPVRDVSWYDVVKWCNAKSEKEGRTPVYRVGTIVYRLGQSAPTLISGANGYRLPNEAEWEWASRGGVNSQGYYFSGSDEVNSVAWHYGNSIGSVADVAGGGEEERGPWPVAQKLPNELGIHDMSGNLLEWCEDIEFGTYRRLRGGGWVYSAGDCGVGVRYFNDDAGYSYDYFGFRVARNAD